MEQQEFQLTFQLSKLIMFNVSYDTVGSNENPYFSTSADEFARGKRDFNRCGQAQDDLTRSFPIARNFWKKWDNLHLKKLTDEELEELMEDIEVLKEEYNYTTDTNFYDLVEFSKQNPKR
jgi:hypothetical protein